MKPTMNPSLILNWMPGTQRNLWTQPFAYPCFK